MTSRIYTFKALTKIWTGDIKGKEDRLITTGLLGSIRWWYEVVARGIGGQPCDPSNTKCIDRKHCVVCELFGCTGWARKFRFDVLDEHGAGQQSQITKGQSFKLRFTPLRAVSDEEWALLELTLRLIARYGAIGGKTVFKPTDEGARQGKIHHQDFGLIEFDTAPGGRPPTDKAVLGEYVRGSRWQSAQQGGLAWASIANFWGGPNEYLARQDANGSTFNQVIGRGQPKGDAGSGDSWLAGRQARSQSRNQSKVEAESKKVFSFRDPPRTFGFVNPHGGNNAVTLDTIKERLEAAWERSESDDQDGQASSVSKLLTGPEILNILLNEQVTAREK